MFNRPLSLEERSLLSRLFSQMMPASGLGNTFTQDRMEHLSADWRLLPADLLEQLRQNLYSGIYPKRIISGGQTGADTAALYAAWQLAIPTGGTAPLGWRIRNPDGSEGSNPDLAGFGLIQHISRDYPPRTIQNVRDSNATAWVGSESSPGGRLTIKTARELGKLLLINPSPEELREQVYMHRIEVLNVAGNRASSANPNIYQETFNLIWEAFRL